MRGFVRSLFPDKRFGFIRPETGKDVFFHKTDVGEVWDEMETLFSRNEKVTVEFESEEGPKGPRATKIEIVFP